VNQLTFNTTQFIRIHSRRGNGFIAYFSSLFLLAFVQHEAITMVEVFRYCAFVVVGGI